MLTALGVVSTLASRQLKVTVTQTGSALAAPIAGTAKSTDVAVRNAPSAGKILQVLTD